MEANSEYQYDFNLKSPSGLPGFELFQNPNTGAWHIHGNGVDSSPVLFSRPYSAEPLARRALEAILNHLKKGIVAIDQEDTAWVMVFRVQGKKQEMMRSRGMASKQACEQQMQFFRQVAGSKNPMAPAVKPGFSTEDLMEFIPKEADQTAASTLAVRRPVHHVFFSNQGHIRVPLESAALPEDFEIAGCRVRCTHMQLQTIIDIQNAAASRVADGNIELSLPTADLPHSGTYYLVAMIQDIKKANTGAPGEQSSLRASAWVQML